MLCGTYISYRIIEKFGNLYTKDNYVSCFNCQVSADKLILEIVIFLCIKYLLACGRGFVWYIRSETTKCYEQLHRNKRKTFIIFFWKLRSDFLSKTVTRNYLFTVPIYDGKKLKVLLRNWPNWWSISHTNIFQQKLD